MPDDATARADNRELVRRGYDAVSNAYRNDRGESDPDSAETTARYADWVGELALRLAPGGCLLDLGCGAGVPADRLLVSAGFDVVGVDISQVQIDRARALVPQATFVCSDLVDFILEPESFDAVISLYALIHVPLEDQRTLFPRVLAALRPRGLFLVIVGHERGQASRTTSAHRCSGTTPTKTHTWNGSTTRASRCSGTATSLKALSGTPWSSPGAPATMFQVLS